MDANSMFSFMDLLVVGCGVYGIYSWYLLVYQHEIKKAFLLGGDYRPEGCKDIQGFAKAIGPKLLATSIGMLVFSGLSLFNDKVANIGVIYWIAFVLFLALLIWYSMVLRKANKEYFAENKSKDIKNKALNKR